MAENVIEIKPKKRFVDYLPCWLKNPHSLFHYFWFMVLLGVLFFCTSLFTNYFTTPFTGDYCAQQIPFYTNGYDDWWHFFTTGEFVFYDTNTFLGANNIGSNSFYYLLDPFFIPIMLCPRQFIAQGIAIMTILKMATAGMMFYLYMRYMGASRRSAKLTGIMYGFSGWTAWYLWFNHMTDVTIVLPLMLLGVEKILKEKKPWVLALSICMMGFVNYFFCICFLLCAFIYAMFRFFQRIKLNNWKNNLLILLIGFLAFSVGILLACFAMLPSVAVALSGSRAETANYLNELKMALKSFDLGKIFDLLVTWDDGYVNRREARHYFFLIELMYPVTSDRGTPLVNYTNQYGNYDNVAGSLYCFIPTLILFFPALIKSIREKHFGPLIATILFILAILSPFFYYAFFGFTQPYSRWFIFPVFCMIAFVGLYLDRFKDDDIWPLNVGAIVVVILAILGALCANHIVEEYGKSTGSQEYYTYRLPIPIVAIVLLMVLHIGGVYFILRFFKKKPQLHKLYTGIVSFELIVMGALVIEFHGVNDYANVNSGLDNNNALHALVEKTGNMDRTYYRSYSSLAGSDATNDAMRNGYNGSSFFHSLYNYNTDDIRNGEAISTGSWSGAYVGKRIGFDTLLGVKYYYVINDYWQYNSRREASSAEFRDNVPFGYEKVNSDYGIDSNYKFNVYKNKEYIEFALSYDAYIPSSGLSNDHILDYESAFLEAAIVVDKSTAGQRITTSIVPSVSKNDFNSLGMLSTSLKNQYPNLTETSVSAHRTQELLTSEKGYKLSYYDTRYKNGNYVANNRLSKAKDMISVDTLGYTKRNTPVYTGLASNDSGSRRYIAIIDFPVGTADERYDEKGMVYYLDNHYSSDLKADIYFVDTTGKIVTYDNHSDPRYTVSSTGWGANKKWRAFYVTPDSTGKAPHIKRIVVVARNTKIEANYNLYYDSYSNYLAHTQKFRDNPITDVEYKTSTWKFKTNFAENRIITTRLAYEDGFTVTCTDKNGNKKDLPVFMTQGGFLSFVSGTGECSYVVDFYPPGLSLGRTLSAIGAFALLSSMVAYIYLSHYFNKKFPIPQFEELSRKKRLLGIIKK